MAAGREEIKNKHKRKHNVQPGVTKSVEKKCSEQFAENTKQEINEVFRNKNWTEQKTFIAEHVSRGECVRRVKKSMKPVKSFTYEYLLRGNKVCKKFFLTTLIFFPYDAGEHQPSVEVQSERHISIGIANLYQSLLMNNHKLVVI